MQDNIRFNDKATWDGGKKTVISVRDGVLEYLGAEIGMEPVDKIFSIYRSPATIAQAASKMQGISLTNDHVDLDSAPSDPIGSVSSAEIVDYFEDGTDSKLAIKNSVDIKADLLDTLSTGKQELSLGYNAKLIPHDKYDFEQRDIEPHHLAVVHAGRCGSDCKFLDKRGNAMEHHIAFCDENGELSLSRVVEILMAVPDAAKNLSLDQLKELMPKLEELLSIANAGNIETDTQEVAGAEMAVESDKYNDEETNMSKDKKDEKEEMKDEEMTEEEKKAAEEKASKEDVKDEEPTEEEDDKKKEMKDAAFQDAISKAVDAKIQIIEKAKTFCDSIDTKLSSVEIMRQAVATEYKDVDFSDTEIEVAFKLLKKTPSNYKNFSDNKDNGGFASLAGKSLKGDK